MADVLRDGRVLVDREAEWPRLKAKERRFRREAEAAERELDEAAWSAMEELGVL
jgi:hypothetical protein